MNTISKYADWSGPPRGKAGLFKPTHGKSYSSEYVCWAAMVQRCTNPTSDSYHTYGGAGVTVCEAWRRSFEEFYKAIGPRPSMSHTIDRIDNSGNYEPGNVRWATRSEQGRNRSTNRVVEYKGQQVRMTTLFYEQPRPITYETFRARIRLGWKTDRALTQPKRKRKDDR